MAINPIAVEAFHSKPTNVNLTVDTRERLGIPKPFEYIFWESGETAGQISWWRSFTWSCSDVVGKTRWQEPANTGSRKQSNTHTYTHTLQTFNVGICHHSGRGWRSLAKINSVWDWGKQVGRRVLTALRQQNCETICTSIIKHLRYPVHLFYIKHTGKWFAYLSDNLQTSSNRRWTQGESQGGRGNNFVNYATLHRNRYFDKSFDVKYTK